MLVPIRFVVPTDSVLIVSARGSDDALIFLGDMDGNLYEMSYEGYQQPVLPPTASAQGMESAIDDYFDGSGVFSLDAVSNAAPRGGSASYPR